MADRPIVGITMGDPFGNGPEISVKALNDRTLYDRCKPLIIGDKSSMEYALKVAKIVNGIDLALNVVREPAEGRYEYGTIDLIDLGQVPADKIPNSLDNPAGPQPFHVGACALGGEAAFQYVVYDIKLAMEGKVGATVTNALSKEAINMAGHHYSGHTEIYADYTHTKKYAMMLAHEDLRVVHVSTHVSLRKACDLVKKDRVLDCIHMANDACKALGIENPKIGVAGLNPHCGEDGMFGTEEIEEIQPAIDEALKEGINIPEKKPTPPDTVFSKALGGWYDIVVVMYHDQGHIPLKVKGFVYNKKEHHWEAVAGINMTLGLPIIRVSVDHGTGFGHAGSGQANQLSLVNAIDAALQMASYRASHKD
ncbi:MAG: PdxA family protein [Lachnospiraceae bacterium]